MVCLCPLQGFYLSYLDSYKDTLLHEIATFHAMSPHKISRAILEGKALHVSSFCEFLWRSWFAPGGVQLPSLARKIHV